MSTKNKRVYVTKEDGKNILKENEMTHKKYMTEEDEDVVEDVPAEDEVPAENADTTETDNDLDTELTASQQDKVEGWVDDILSSELDYETPSENLDIDSDSDDELNAEPTLNNPDLPIDGTTLEDIIDQDDSFALLQSELESSVLDMDDEIEETEEEETIEESFEDDDFEDDDFDMDYEEIIRSDKNADKAYKAFDTEVDSEIETSRRDDHLAENADPELDKKLDEAIDIMHGLQVKEPASVKVTKAEYNKIDKISPTEIVTPEERNWQVLNITKEKFAEINKKNLETAKKMKAELSRLKMENYALGKANSLLVLASDVLTEDSRAQLVESMLSLKTKEAIDEGFKKVSAKIKSLNEAKKSSLNESASRKITDVKQNNEVIDYELERKKHLMGLPTKIDVYNK